MGVVDPTAVSRGQVRDVWEANPAYSPGVCRYASGTLATTVYKSCTATALRMLLVSTACWPTLSKCLAEVQASTLLNCRKWRHNHTPRQSYAFVVGAESTDRVLILLFDGE